MSAGTIGGKKRQMICRRLILFSSKYTMLLPAAAFIALFTAAGSMQNMHWKTQVTKEGWAEVLPIYLSMLDGDDRKKKKKKKKKKKMSKFGSLYLTYRSSCSTSQTAY